MCSGPSTLLYNVTERTNSSLPGVARKVLTTEMGMPDKTRAVLLRLEFFCFIYSHGVLLDHTFCALWTLALCS